MHFLLIFSVIYMCYYLVFLFSQISALIRLLFFRLSLFFCSFFFSPQLFIFYHLSSVNFAPSRWFSLTFSHCGELSVYSSVAKNNFWQNAYIEHMEHIANVTGACF